MADLNETPKSNRIHIAFFGLRNAGKSTLVNAFANQSLVIVSEVAGTTTDPVSKAMEILPLGPCLITDTAGLDDVGELGQMRVKKTLGVLETTDIAVWVWGGNEERLTSGREPYQAFTSECARRKIAVLEYQRGDSVEGLKQKIASLKLADDTPGLLDGLVEKGDRVICVCPIDESAPKGRLILPQVQVVRDCLDRHIVCTVCQPDDLSDCLAVGLTDLKGRLLVITDSQAFARVDQTIGQANNPTILLTSFSILFARQKGDMKAFLAGLKAVKNLRDGDNVLIAEGCTHHRQCNDIGATKIPKALAKLTGGKKLNLQFASGGSFPVKRSDGRTAKPFSLVVQCGGCMLTRREMLRRIDACRGESVPIINYGILLAGAAGLELSRLVY